MARKKVTPVADEQRTDGVLVVASLVDRLDQLETAETMKRANSEPQAENTAPEVPVEDAPSDLAVEVAAMDAEMDGKAGAEGETTPATPKPSSNKILSATSFNWLKRRTRPEMLREILDEIRKGVGDSTIALQDNGTVSHDVVVEMVVEYEKSNGGFGSAGNPLDRDAWNFLHHSQFRPWVTNRTLGEILGKKPGDSITNEELKHALIKMEVREDGPRVTCYWCLKEFQPVSGRVFKNGYPLVDKFSKPVYFGAFTETNTEEVHACHQHCQREVREQKIAEAKAQNDKPDLPFFKPLVEVEARRQEREDKRHKDAADAARKKSALDSLGGGRIGQIVRDATARSNQRDMRDRNRHDRDQNRRDQQWK